MAKAYKNYDDKARQIIKDNNYLVLATSDLHSQPWASPVFYTYDDHYNFYFLSAVDSKHAENIIANKRISFAIFDSSQKVGTADGVQADAEAKLVGKSEVQKVIELYSDRLFPIPNIPPTERYDPDSYTEPSEFRFFKIVPTTLYVTGIDRRVEVDLNK